MLLRQPNRLRVIVGKLAGILLVAAAAVAFAEAATFVLSLMLGSLIRGGTVELGLGRALLTAAVYAAIAATVTLLLVSRRDVTA